MQAAWEGCGPWKGASLQWRQGPEGADSYSLSAA